MIKVAIAGNIASGKSTVQGILEKMGYNVLDTDEASRDLLTVNNKELYEAFKDYDVFESGEFSRYKIAQLIFSNEPERLKLAAIMHPQVIVKILNYFEDNKDEEIIFVGIPLLFEAKAENIFDKILFVYTDDDIRLERLLKRNNYTLEHAKGRMNCQQSQDEKANMSDYVIKNNVTFEDLENEVSEILKSIIK